MNYGKTINNNYWGACIVDRKGYLQSQSVPRKIISSQDLSRSWPVVNYSVVLFTQRR
jgi:hypothetical protein